MNLRIKVVLWASITAVLVIVAFRFGSSRAEDYYVSKIEHIRKELANYIDDSKRFDEELDRRLSISGIELPSTEVKRSIGECPDKIVKTSIGVTKGAVIFYCIISSLFTAYVVALVFVRAVQEEHVRFKRVDSERAELYKQCDSLKLRIEGLEEKYSRLEVDKLRLLDKLNYVLAYKERLTVYLSLLEEDNLQFMGRRQQKVFGGYVADGVVASDLVLLFLALGRIEQRVSGGLSSTLWSTKVYGYDVLVSSLVREQGALLKKEKDRLIRRVKVKGQYGDKYEYKLKSVCSVCFEEKGRILVVGCKCWAPICHICFPTMFYVSGGNAISEQVRSLGEPFVGARCSNCRGELSLSLLFALEKYIKEDKLKLNLRIESNEEHVGVLGWLFPSHSTR